MVMKRCLNCQDYKADDRGLDGEPLPPGTFSDSGVCQLTDTRKKDGWACGKWIQKETEVN